MVLSDKEIYKYISSGDLIFATPDRALPFNQYQQVQPASVDLRLSNRILRFKGDVKEFDVKNLDQVKDYIETLHVPNLTPIVLQPNEVIFCQTFEQIKMPKNCIGIVEGKSRFARLGLAIHRTGGFINPDFEGVMPLQIINNNRIPLTIYPFISVCQLILFEIKSIPLIPYPERTDNPYYKEHIAGHSVLHKDSVLGNETTGNNSIKIEQERRKIDQYLNSMGYGDVPKSVASQKDDLLTGSKPEKNVQINIQGVNFSNLNMGKIIGNVSSNLEQLNTVGDYDITNSIRELTQEIAKNNHLTESLKIEYIEYLKLLSEEAIKSEDNRNTSAIKIVYKTIEAALTNIAHFAEIWHLYGGPIKTFFAISG